MGVSFKKPTTTKTAPAPAKDAPAKPAASRRTAPRTFADRMKQVEVGEGRTPMLEFGRYLVKVGACELAPSENPAKRGTEWYRIPITVLESSGAGAADPGAERVILQACTIAGDAIIKRFGAACAGFATVAEYEEADPDNLFIGALFGDDNEYTSQLDEVTVRVECRRGKPREDGTHWSEYSFMPAGEDDGEDDDNDPPF